MNTMPLPSSLPRIGDTTEPNSKVVAQPGFDSPVIDLETLCGENGFKDALKELYADPQHR